MYRIAKSDADPATLAMFEWWVTQNDIFRTESGDTVTLFSIPEEFSMTWSFLAGDLGDALTEIDATATHPSVTVDGPEWAAGAEGTWYQFAAVMRGRTGISTPNLDVLDEVVSYRVDGEGHRAVFTYMIRKVVYVETKARYRGKVATLQMTQVRYENKRWTAEMIEVPDHKDAPDLVKFGNVTSLDEYWTRRTQDCIDPSDIKVLYMLREIAKIQGIEVD